MDKYSQQVKIEVNSRIHLSEIRPGDKPAFVKYLNDQDIYKHTLRIPHPYTDADAEGFLAHVQQSNARHGHPVNFAVRDEHEQLIGGIGFEGLSYNHRAEIGYWLGKPYWGQGIMTEVVRSACAYGFEQWKLVRITAHVFTCNHASGRVLEKCGFQLEGTLSKNHFKAGMYLDSKLYALVK